MKEEIRMLRKRFDRIKGEYEDVKRSLDKKVRECAHVFGKTKYDPIHNEAYTIPGDPPGTMGVDWRGPVYVPAENIARWSRECTLCGLVEYTEGVIEKTERRVPKW